MPKASVCRYKYCRIHKKTCNQRNFLPLVFFFCFFTGKGWTRYKIKPTFLKLFKTFTVAKWCTEFPV